MQNSPADRVWSRLEIKSIDEEQRVIEGLATTPSTDLQDDVVDPMGGEFTLPMPFMMDHGANGSDDSVGHVVAANPTPKGIAVRIKILKDPALPLLDKAWAKIRLKLVNGLSIGFRAIEREPIKGTFGTLYKKWRWLELSGVVVAANPDCSITHIKSADIQSRAALGLTGKNVVRLQPSPGASGSTQPQKGYPVKTTSEQIAAFEAKRAASVAQMTEIMNKSGESGETLDKEAGDAYDALAEEIKTIDGHIARLKAHEQFMVGKATALVPAGANANVATPAAGAAARYGNVTSVKSNLPQGVEFARYAKCLGAAQGNRSEALEFAKAHYPDMHRVVNTLKAAVAAGTTTDATWAGALVDYTHFAGDFVEFLRPMTILGKFGQNGIPDLRRVPFNIQIPSQTSGGAGYWVGQGQPKPLTKFDYANILLTWAKVANIAVLTEEVMRFSSPSVDLLVRNALAEALQGRLDTDFVSPSKAAVANVSPASITYGLTPIQASGTTAAAVRTDVKAIMATFIAANITPANGVWIMPATVALNLSLMHNDLGQREFPGISMIGGTFEGLPVIVSQYVNNSVSGGGMVILVDASEVYLSDDGGVTIDASREASLQMLDNPTNASSDGTATTMVSMFQTNSVALRAERMINWKLRRSAGCAYLDNVNWTA